MDLIRLLRLAGWQLDRVCGSHHVSGIRIGLGTSSSRTQRRNWERASSPQSESKPG